MVADVLSHRPDLAVAIELSSNLMGLINTSQARAQGTDEYNRIKLDAANGQHNVMIYEGLVSHSCGADSHVIIIPDNS